MLNSEEEILKKICLENDINPDYIKQLIFIEKEYADRNLSKRRGIYTRILDTVNEWIKEEEERKQYDIGIY